MQLVEQRRIDGYDPRWAAIDAAAFARKNLYNAALYLTRQASLMDHAVLGYGELDRLLQPTGDYRALPARVAQWVVRQVALAWKSYFAACAACTANPSRFPGHPKLPKYRDKQGRNLLVSSGQAISQHPRNAGWIVPSGSRMRVATNQPIATVAQVRVAPHATYYSVVVSDERARTSAHVDSQWVAGMDPGVNNLAVITANQPGFAPLLVNGRPLKALKQWYNKRCALYQAPLPEQRHISHQLDLLADKQKRRVDGYLHVASRRIVDHLVQHQIGTLIVGKNDGWKHEVRLGKRTNKTFVLPPHARFIAMLTYKAQLGGRQVILTEVASTSKCSVLDDEPLRHQMQYAGKRKKRGLFMTAKGRLINADVNGAYNSVSKVVPNACGNGIEGVVVHPVRLRLADRRLAS
jgi:putative transposase